MSTKVFEVLVEEEDLIGVPADRAAELSAEETRWKQLKVLWVARWHVDAENQIYIWHSIIFSNFIYYAFILFTMFYSV